MAGVYIARRNHQVTGHLMRPLPQLSNMFVTFMGSSRAILQKGIKKIFTPPSNQYVDIVSKNTVSTNKIAF